jgi:hypothetical protein
MVVGGDLEVLRVGRADAIAQARYEGGFIFDPRNSEAAVLANLSALITLGALAPLRFGVRFGGHGRLTGEVSDDIGGNLLAAVWEAPVKLEGFKRNSEAEPGGACLVGEQFTLVGGKCPVLGQFFRLSSDSRRTRLCGASLLCHRD